MAPDPIVYCLEQITDYDRFEVLCTDLMAKSGYPEIEPLGGFKDKGRDAIHTSSDPDGVTTIFAYSVREDWHKKLLEDCGKVSRHGHDCQRVIFLTTSDITATQRDNAISEVKDNFGFALELYPLMRLRTLLAATHPEVKADHPQIFIPPFFPQSGGLSLVPSRTILLVDYVDEDIALASWLGSRLTLAGYTTWLRHQSPTAGQSLSDMIEALIKHRAFRYLPILSPYSVPNTEMAARRVMAHAENSDLVVPILADPIDNDYLEEKTKALESVRFDSSWAEGLERLLQVLDSVNCPKASNSEEIALRAFFPPDVIETKAEQIHSNQFLILQLPEYLFKFEAEREISREEYGKIAGSWAFRRVGKKTFVSFHPPPQGVLECRIKFAAKRPWKDKDTVFDLPAKHLLAELVRKSILVRFSEKGLKYSESDRSYYFPSGLLKDSRLNLMRPDDKKSYVKVCGERAFGAGKGRTRFRYSLSPRISVDLSSALPCVIVHVGVRLTDEAGRALTGRTILSRRKKLCKGWWNRQWFNRVISLMQFISDDDSSVIIGSSSGDHLIVGTVPQNWSAPVSICEDRVVHEEVSLEEVELVGGADGS